MTLHWAVTQLHCRVGMRTVSTLPPEDSLVGHGYENCLNRPSQGGAFSLVECKYQLPGSVPGCVNGLECGAARQAGAPLDLRQGGRQ